MKKGIDERSIQDRTFLENLMSSIQKPYVSPTIRTIDTSEILELIGPARGYGRQLDPTTDMLFSDQPSEHRGFGSR